MPARISRANTAVAAKVPKDKRRKSKRRGLDAYERAQEQVPEERSTRSHRLGEVEDDEPRRKRRRDEDEKDDDEEENERPQRKKSARRNDDPDVEYGSDSSGNEWTMGGIGDDDDDSDLDSDEAFGESDEERFGGFTFRGSKSSKKKTKSGKKPMDMDLDERSESEEDDGDSQDEEGLGLGDDAVDLAAMLDDEEEDKPSSKNRRAERTDEDSSNGEDDESSESESESEDEDDGDDEERVARMRDRLEALDSTSRKMSAPPSTAAATVDDFLEDTGLDFDRLTSKKKKSQKPTTIAAPLPKRQQNKLDREVATEKAKEQLDRWRDTVVRNRRAEFLSFPLQSTADQAAPTGTEKFIPATQEAPQSELEESIQRIMQESGLAAKQKKADADELDEETALLKAEELAEKQLPVEEVLRRRRDLRRQRELLFREEIKAKRIAKIKSKSYRRVHRRERERDADREKKMLEEMGIDPEDEDEKERADRKRAEARMGTKHKDSKWAKSLRQTNRTAWDENARDGVVQQAKRAEDLKRRIAGEDMSDEEGSDLPSDNDEVDFSQIADLENMKVEKKSGLAGLKFMQDAEERKRKANEEDVNRLRRDMAIADGDEVESEAEEETLGRAIFGPQGKDQKPKTKEKKLEFEAPDEHSDDDEQARDNEQEADANIIMEKPSSKQKSQPNGISKSTTASGPLAAGWLTKEPAPDKNAWLAAPKGSKKSQINDQVALETSVPETDFRIKPSEPSVKTSSKVIESSTAPNSNGWTTVTHNEGSDDEEPQNAILSTKEASPTLQQRAFAGDNVEAAFEAEKADLAASEDEKEISDHLPGWGSWAGEGLTKSIRKANARARHNPLFKTKLPGGVKQADRRDVNLDKVIVSEKQDRKGKKYLAPVLPRGFETKEQYERSTRLPMGPEWSTKEVHQRMTKPKVIVKRGVNVRAIEKPVT